MPKYYVETDQIQQVLQAPDAVQAAKRVLDKEIDMGKRLFGQYISISEIGFTMGKVKSPEHLKNDLMFSVTELLANPQNCNPFLFGDEDEEDEPETFGDSE